MLNNKKLKAIFPKEQEKLKYSMILERPMTRLPMQKYLFGIKKRNKSLKLKPMTISYQLVHHLSTKMVVK